MRSFLSPPKAKAHSTVPDGRNFATKQSEVVPVNKAEAGPELRKVLLSMAMEAEQKSPTT